jgi:hypothetical protein
MDNFWNKVEKTDTCWLWTSGLNSAGYGQYSLKNKRILAHRYVYENMVGSLIDGLVIDHTCRNIICVNPSHLEQVTQSENVIRSLPFRKKQVPRKDKTHCQNGHKYTAENTIILYSDLRICGDCQKNPAGKILAQKTA